MGIQVQISANQIEQQRKGFASISLTHFSDTAEPSIAAGSAVEISGALYQFTADETGTGWGGIGINNTVYMLLTPAGASVSWSYTTTAPIWDTAKQGWYTAGNRVVASLYKDSGSLYQSKFLLPAWSQSMPLPGGARNVIKTSGALGTLSVTGDTEYILTAASTATLPSGAPLGCRLTFKAKTTATSTITANTGHTIGTTTSTSFVLYAQEDYVTLEWDGVSIWYVVATNGPVQSSDQTATTTTTTLSSWTAVGNGLSLGTLSPGVYDFEIVATLAVAVGSTVVTIAVGSGTTPLSGRSKAYAGAGTYFPSTVAVRGYVLTAAATIQGIYYSGSASNAILYDATVGIGRIYARRIG